MDVSSVSSFISSVGFPIFVAVWMLYKSTKDTEQMTETINELKVAITELSTLLDGHLKQDEGGKNE